MRNFIVWTLFSAGLLLARVTGVNQLRWIDPQGRHPMPYAEWCSDHILDQNTTIDPVYRSYTSNQQYVVDVIVNAKLYPFIIGEIDTFTQDLVAAGYSVQLDTITGMSHIELRNHLASISSLVGAILVGETPVAWFETNGFGGWEEFPHDIYFSDLNGTYIDADADGIYDDHTGSVAPEIWIGRIYARDLTWDSEVSLVKNYFHKNHLYRTGGLSVPDRGLSFVDDDWSYWTTCYLDEVYPTVTVINNMAQTIASNYRTQLNTGYEWIHICAHSSPWGHTFRDGYSYAGTVFNYELFALEPYALFYNLFACSGTRFVEENHSAGWYIFVAPYGLLAVGSTKTGSMLYFEDFYIPLGQQQMCIGDAFKYWFTIWGEQDWDWFYGMNILGDPTLKPRGAIAKRAVETHSPPEIEPANRYWQDITVVASHSESDGFPRIAVTPDNTAHIVWESGRSTLNGRCDIYSAYRSGSTWSGAYPIGSWEYWDYSPTIGIDGNGRPVAIWASYDEGQYDLYYSVHTGSWSSRQLVHAHDPAYDIRPAVVLDRNDRLWVSWETRRNVDRDIYACYFNGSTWSSPQQVTSFGDDETMPTMAVDSTGQPWVFYCRRYDDKAEIWGSYYTGSQWLIVGPISGSQEQAYHPAAAVGGNDSIYVAWQAYDTGNADIYISHSLNGTTWSTPEQVTTSQQSDVFPVLAALPVSAQNKVLLAYQSREYGDWNIHTAFRRNGLWSDYIVVYTGNGPDINPHVTIDNTGEAWLCWQNGENGNWEIMTAHCSGYGVREFFNDKTPGTLSVHPSPFSRVLHITVPAACTQIRVYDVHGSLVTILNPNVHGKATWRPDVPTGVYYVVVQQSSTVRTEKVVFVQ